MQGGIWGLGAPLGSLAWRIVSHWPVPLRATIVTEWQTASYYYLYMTIGTVASFSLFGYIRGRHAEKLNRLSITDGLTGIYNHRYLQENLKHEIERSHRYVTPLTCLMIDIDDFKKINDQHGHPFGDEVLKTIAGLISRAVRRTDEVGRYGGEEFLVIMPQTTTEAAQPLAERILKTVADCTFASEGDTVSVTVSIGLATYPFPKDNSLSKTSLLSAADQALYRAKQAGKNRAVVWN